MNVILLVIDALRSDHLGINGYSRDTSPNIDKIANEGVLFSNAITPTPSSTPSIASMMTGLYPHSHGLRFIHRQKLNPKITTLAEILQTHGYKTIGHDLGSVGDGIEKGFEEFSLLRWRISNKIRRTIKKLFYRNYKIEQAEELTLFAKKQIKKHRNKKFFLYLHYDDLHWPYEPPKPFGEMFDPDYTGDHIFNDWDNKIKRGDMIFNNPLPKEEIYHAIAHYDGLIRFIDRQIGDLIRFLEEMNLKDKTLIVITADHGESLGEHNLHFQHTVCLYEEGIRIPLIISSPDIKQPKKIETQVQSIDIMPTILDILGITLIETIDGKSLIPLVNGGGDNRKYLFGENGELLFKQNNRIFIPGIKGKWRMIRTNEWKLIYIPHPEKDIYELYNLKNDPKEKINLVDREAEIARMLKEELFKWMESSEEDKDMDLTDKSKRLLRKIGYME
ncbi:sulfatase-like hydrolase/transferase [Candidatus Woesearchaeota archaeon]|nr:sulfatase-like hydrolase/transferase [Candidatus Woesearchaeota archaeon]